MTMVALLTRGQAKSLERQTFCRDSYFNPIEDADGNWVISLEEVEQCNNLKFGWVKRLRTIPYNPKPSPPMPGMTEQTEMQP
jgi:hypothetical protein